MRKRTPGTLTESLEERKLLAAQITDAWVGDLADWDQDGFFRNGNIYVDVVADQAQSVYISIDEDDGGATDDRIFTAQPVVIGAGGQRLRVPIHSDFMNLPGDEGPGGTIEFEINLFDTQTGQLLASWDAVREPDIGNLFFESGLNDGGQVFERPNVPSVQLDPRGPVLVGENLLTTIRATDVTSGGGVSGVYWWIDINRNSKLDLGLETDSMRQMFLTGGNIADGTWQNLSTITAQFGIGTLRGAITAWDIDGNLATSLFYDLVVTNDAPPQVTNLAVSAPVINAGDPFTLEATVQDDHGVAAVTFFYDANDDGLWTPGTDTDLGADTISADGWKVTVTARPEWGSDAQARFVADARDSVGQWARTTGSATARLNARPAITGTTVDGPGFVTVGEPVTVRATANDDTGVRAVTFYLDRNQDGRWTAGTDVDLGADFDGSDGWSRAWIVQPGWVSASMQVRATAVDVDGAFGVSGAPATVAFNARPVVTGLAASAPVISWGQTLTLTPTVNDPDGSVAVVTFFADINRDGVWTPGVDWDFGFDDNGGNGWALGQVAREAWTLGTIRFVAGAKDNRGAWATQSASVEVRVNAPPRVLEVVSQPAGFVSWGQTLKLTANVTDNIGVSVVTFFFDLDSNGRFTPGDIDLGADFNGTDGWSISKVVPAWWGAGPAKFVASARDADNAWSTQTATANVQLNDRVQLSGFMGTPNPVAFGSAVQLDLRARDVSGVSAVTVFVDVNGDGRWTGGVDIDLGAAARQSGTTNDGVWRRTVTANWGHGTFRILADARDTNGIWTGAPTLLQVVVT
jgi:hypothetical protein